MCVLQNKINEAISHGKLYRFKVKMYCGACRNSNQRAAHQVRGRLRQGNRTYNAGGPSRVQLAVINDKSNVVLEYREALKLFRYDYETGALYWRRRTSNRVPKTLEANLKFKFNNNHGVGRAKYVKKR